MKPTIGSFIQESIVKEICNLYTIIPREIIPLKLKTRCVFEIKANKKAYILKIFDAEECKIEEIQGEIDLAYACLNEGIDTYKVLYSINDVNIEQFNAQNGRRLYAFLYEKLEGYEVPEDNDAFREFTPQLLKDWGALMGKLHRVSRQFTDQNRTFSRMLWHEMNDTNYRQYIPPDDTAVIEVFDTLSQTVQAITRTSENFGLIHGDLHYGNFFITENGLSLIDFDSSSYYYYAADIAISLYSLLPYPRYRREERRSFAKVFFEYFLEGYLSEYELPKENLQYVPLFLEYEDMVNYIALYRHWDMNHLSTPQRRILRRNRYHIVNRIPFVDLPDLFR